MAEHTALELPHSKAKEAIARVLVHEKYLSSVAKIERDGRHFLLIQLSYDKGKPVISDIKQVSRPGMRIYAKTNKIPRVSGSLGMSVISTSRGVMSDREARKAKLGGEIICKVW